jgi:hypothetical protein
MSADSTNSIGEAACRLLSQAKDNGGGLSLHNIFGPAAEDWTSIEEIMGKLREHDVLQWCLQIPVMLEVHQDDSLVPPVWFLLTPTGQAFVDLRNSPVIAYLDGLIEKVAAEQNTQIAPAKSQREKARLRAIAERCSSSPGGSYH